MSFVGKTPPLYSVLELESMADPGEYYCALSIMSNGRRFYITVLDKDLELDSATGSAPASLALKQKFVELVEDESMEGQEELQDWLVQPCLSYLEQLAPAVEGMQPLTLHQYYDPFTFVFELVNTGGQLTAVRTSDSSQIAAHLSPQFAISDLPRSSELPFMDASCLKIVPVPQQEDYAASDAPTYVTDSRKKYFFKAVQDSNSFKREFTLLSLLRKAGLSQKLRVPTICGLVCYSDKPGMIMGMLMEEIEHVGSLDHFADDENYSNIRQKWVRQVEDIMYELHGNDIVWGDVKPSNILIDKNQDAWVIDFGGGYNSRWVDRDVMETTAGDIQGISRIAQSLAVELQKLV